MSRKELRDIKQKRISNNICCHLIFNWLQHLHDFASTAVAQGWWWDKSVKSFLLPHSLLSSLLGKNIIQMQLLYRTLSKSKSIFMHNKSLSPNPTCKSQFLNILTYAQMIYNSISLTSANHKKSQTSFTDSLNARVTALLVMKRCISYHVQLFPLKKKKACNKCHTSQVSIQRATRPVWSSNVAWAYN